MMLRTFRPSSMTAGEIEAFIGFVVAGGEINPATMPALVARAVSLVTLHHDDRLIGTAAIKTPFAGHHRNEFAKAGVPALAPSYPFELGWVVVDEAFRRMGHGRTLVGHALDQLGARGVYATTKSDGMRAMLPDFGFCPLGDAYPSGMDPHVSLSLHGRSAS
jgi:predicted GNAT family N-acyltransferase